MNKIPVAPQKYEIKQQLFTDTIGNMYIQVKNRSLMHPSIIQKPRLDSLYLDSVYLYSDNRKAALADILDTSSFEGINAFGTYFRDTAFVYVYSVKPHPVQFFALKRDLCTFPDIKKDYVLHDTTVYYLGAVVDGLQAVTVSVISLPGDDTDGVYEFLTDGEMLYYGEYPVDTERLGFFSLSGKDKAYIKKHYYME